MSIVNRESIIVNRGSDETANFGSEFMLVQGHAEAGPSVSERRGMTTLADVNFD